MFTNRRCICNVPSLLKYTLSYSPLSPCSMRRASMLAGDRVWCELNAFCDKKKYSLFCINIQTSPSFTSKLLTRKAITTSFKPSIFMCLSFFPATFLRRPLQRLFLLNITCRRRFDTVSQPHTLPCIQPLYTTPNLCHDLISSHHPLRVNQPASTAVLPPFVPRPF